MGYITTYKGGAFYNWYVGVYGYAPPAQVDDQSLRYIAWQHGVTKANAKQIPYGATASQLAAALAAQAHPAAVALAPDVTAHAASPPGGTGGSSPPPNASYPTCYGIPLTHTQYVIVEEVFNIGLSLKAPRICLEAAYYAMCGESDIQVLTGNGGVFQTTCDMTSYNDGSDYQGQAHSFFVGGTCFARGAISYSQQYGTAWQIANATEENAVWGNSRGDSYQRSGFTTGQLEAAASNAVSYILPNLPATGNPYVPPAGSSPSVGGVFNIFSALNWAGDFENLWQYVQGGSNEAANMAKVFNNTVIAKTKYVKFQ